MGPDKFHEGCNREIHKEKISKRGQTQHINTVTFKKDNDI